MALLSSKTISSIDDHVAIRQNLPEKVLQFGAGVFLRAFADYFIDQANRLGQFNGRVVAVARRRSETSDKLNAQDGLYSLQIQGLRRGETVNETRIISSLSRVLSAADQWNEVLSIARSEDLQVVISNTTEVGLQYDGSDQDDLEPPKSFPGKLALVLKERALHFNFDNSKGLVVLPCELLDNNGQLLKTYVLRLAAKWEWDDAIIDWIENANVFCNCLVDRIVPGKPLTKPELSYEDKNLISAEPYTLWAIDGDEGRLEKLGLADADPGIIVCDDIEPYRTRKIRILNGCHTTLVPVALLAGHKLVREAMQDPDMASFIKDLLHNEILPTLEVEGKDEFAREVFDRFSNPFIDHQLIRIMLHATMKTRVRLLSSLVAYHDKFDKIPPNLLQGFQAYLKFKRETGDREIDGIEIRNEPPDAGGEEVRQLLKGDLDILLKRSDIWGSDISFLLNEISI